MIIAVVIILSAFAVKALVFPKDATKEPEKPEVTQIMTRAIIPKDFDEKAPQVVLDFTSNASDNVKKIHFLIQNKITTGEIPYVIENPDGEKVTEGTLKAGDPEKELSFEYKKGTWKWIGQSTGDDEGRIRIIFAQKIQKADRLWTEEDKSGYVIDPNK